jgi:hypothetical protein
MACGHKMHALLAAAVVAGLLCMLGITQWSWSISECQQQMNNSCRKLIDTYI